MFIFGWRSVMVISLRYGLGVTLSNWAVRVNTYWESVTIMGRGAMFAEGLDVRGGSGPRRRGCEALGSRTAVMGKWLAVS